MYHPCRLSAATLHIGGRSYIRHPRRCHAVVTGTHLEDLGVNWKDNIKMDPLITVKRAATPY